MQNSVTVGAPVTSTTVSGGAASATYTLPGNTLSGPYTIVATYKTGGNFAGSTDSAHTLTVQAGSYAYSRSLTIDHTKVSNSNQTNFPVLVSLTDPLLKDTSNGGHIASPNGYDMIFTSDARCTSKLNHEVEGWSALTGHFTAWVNVPTVSHTRDTIIYLCYGNAAVTTDQSNRTAIWDSNFKAVYHLSQDPAGASPQLLDSTSNRVNLTMANNYGPAAGSEAGVIGNSVYLPWAGEYHGNSASSGSAKSGVGSGARTVSTWMNFHTLPAPSTGVVGTIPLPTRQNVFTLGTGPNNNLELLVLEQWVGINIDAPVSITPGSWYYVAGEYDGKTYRLYVNGVQVASALANGNVPADAPVYLGLGYCQYFSDVHLDETRFSNTARSADWIATEYNNQSNPSAFYSVGTETAASLTPAGGSIPFNGAIRGVTSTQALASFTVSNPAACSIIIYTDAARTIPAHDSDASLFPGATACNRAGNIVSGHNVNAVLGSRTVQMGADSIAYSRALAQQTQYWGLITDLTNSQTLSFEFTTLPIPFGQTWNDMPPALAPAISNTDATQVIVDPQTGAPLHRMSLLNDVAITPVWGAKADANISCSPVQVAGPTGMGVHCFIDPVLYWVNTTTGQRTFLGMATLPYNPATDGWLSLTCSVWTWDTTDGNKGYCFDPSSHVLAMSYNGSNADVGPIGGAPLVQCGSAPCWNMTNLTPASTNKSILQQLFAWSPAAAAFVTQYSAPGAIYVKWMGVDSTPAWMFDIQGNQQTTSWYAVLNLTTGNLVAVSPPGRWSGDHNSGDAGAGTTGVTFLGYCSYNGPFTGADNDLDGPFIAAGNLTAGERINHGDYNHRWAALRPDAGTG